MKSVIKILVFFLSSVMLFSQNITNTLGSNGLFTIEDGSTTFFSLDQSDGELTLSGSIVIPSQAHDSQVGTIFKGSQRFIHTYKPSGATGGNTFIGINSGNFSMAAGNATHSTFNTSVGYASMYSLTTGYFNSALGYQALNKNTYGYENNAFGYHALFSNISGVYNCAFGSESLESNTTGGSNSAFGHESLKSNEGGTHNASFGSLTLTNNTFGIENSAFGAEALSAGDANYNSAFGFQALRLNSNGASNAAFGHESLESNLSGDENSAFGKRSLRNNSSGNQNAAFGNNAMIDNTTGDYNSAFGDGALSSNTSGIGNTAIGFASLSGNTTGDRNVAIGRSAGSSLSGTSSQNNIIIGYNAQVASSSGSNQIRLGNSSISDADIEVSWDITSDRRAKANISDVNLGLDFISKLRPVSYYRRNDDRKRTEFGFIAQEVEKLLNEFGVENYGMVSVADDGTYSMRYDDLFAPLVKAVQQLKAENDELKKEIASIKSTIREQVKVELSNILLNAIEEKSSMQASVKKASK